MVLILSIEEDLSTDAVIDWLSYLNKDFIRINGTDTITDVEIDCTFNVRFSVNNRSVDLSNITSFWYRRGKVNLDTYQIGDKHFPFSHPLNKHLRSESEALSQMIMKTLKDRSSLGDYYNADTNKFRILMKARELGLAIPVTIVTSSKGVLKQFIEREGFVITKTIDNMIMAYEDGKLIMSYTKRITMRDLDSIGETFSPSLFQKEIPKRYELRIFYLLGEFYAMAIFSQLDKQTEVDFRVYNRAKPNRNVPFALPLHIKEKLHALMVRCRYETGSIDMIYTTNSDFVFLEINPIGQYDMVNAPCNYLLNKRVAENLN